MSFAGRLRHELTSGWAVVGRPNQQLPAGDWWSIWMLLSGRGFGKTRVLSEMANAWAISGKYERLALVAATAADCRDVLVEGESGVLACAPQWARPTYQSTRRRVEWPNGAVGYLYSTEEPDRLRGPQHSAALGDELASWRDPSTFDMLMFGLRLGQRPRTIIATTPRPTRLIRELLAREGKDLVVTRGTTFENASNLAPGFLDTIVAKYEGTRLGRQELLAEVLLDTPGALWKLDDIDKARRERAPELQRIVVAIDPAVSSHEGSDETGLIVCGRDERQHGYVIEDLSGKYSPDDWARAAVRHGADRIVAEINQGGDLVAATLRMVDGSIPFTGVHASRGKYVRAEPVAAMYQQLRIHHVGNFPELEDQLCGFTADMDRGRQGSPDRLDALVWGLTELLVERIPHAGMLEFYRLDLERMRRERGGSATAAPSAPLPPAGDSVQSVSVPTIVPGAPIILQAPPHRHFQAQSGARYELNVLWEIVVGNHADAESLIRAGCSLKPVIGAGAPCEGDCQNIAPTKRGGARAGHMMVMEQVLGGEHGCAYFQDGMMEVIQMFFEAVLAAILREFL